MVQKMLIDASHPEETRVAVVDGNKLEDFDYESQARKQLRGNIYLARVTRVEPSLQAAFVEYGGNRHGFLAFNEIHPDYYQIPYEDRRKLIEAEKREAGDDEEDEAPAEGAEGVEDAAAPEEEAAEIAEQAAKRRRRAMRSYKIQEVIKRRQVMLVQVVKEERGNKGAALTTYLSLAGRYCVLMPNTSRGGGISRKISDNADRKRLKGVVDSLNLPEGMGVIVRTAGFSRTKAEIKRDYEYLLRLWERIREETLGSTAPTLIYEEGNLIKRSIRDLYDKDIEEIYVEGEEAYRQAKDFMRVLIPSHAKKVQPYRDSTPLFLRQQVEQQIDQIYNPVVQLKSGGYLVINPTEALISIDVNSGRSTKERNIEATALKTNLEAADEACRQMRLRDLAGLIVIDFIDMEESKNNRAVEKRLRDALKSDRSRVQTGKISQFGLLEMSRQRRRASVFEGSTEVCPHCAGTGFMRSKRSSALHALRAIEEEAVKLRSALVRVKAPAEVALYLLNEKRGELQHFESQFGMRALVEVDNSLTPPDFKLERLEALPAGAAPAAQAESAPEPQDEDQGSSSSGGRRRRRRGRRSEEPETEAEETTEADDATESDGASEADSAADEARDGGSSDDDDAPKRKRRRRGRRGGRGRRKNRDGADAQGDESGQSQDSGDDDSDTGSDDAQADSADAETAPETAGETAESGESPAEGMEVVQPQADDELKPTETAKPRRRRRSPRKKAAEAETAEAEAPAEAAETQAEPDAPVAEAEEAPEAAAEPEADAAPEPETADAPEAAPAAEAEPEPEQADETAGEVVDFPGANAPEEEANAEPEADAETAEAEPEPAPAPEPQEDKRPTRRGWWQRRSGD